MQSFGHHANALMKVSMHEVRKEKLGEKKFEKRIRKAVKLLENGLKRLVPKKEMNKKDTLKDPENKNSRYCFQDGETVK